MFQDSNLNKSRTKALKLLQQKLIGKKAKGLWTFPQR